MNQNARCTLLRRVQIARFAAHEAVLYLDTHPNDAAALAYWRKYNALAADAAAAYEKKYGPLSVTAADGSPWPWVSGPWPWEPEANA